jgi:uncharacterized protein YndB with AHSA1/START domain
LEITTPSDHEIVMKRVFEAPRQLVFDAHTKPELVKRWLYGPEGWSLPVCEIDLRPGGAFRYVWSGQDGTQMGSRGTFREVVPPERIVHTEVFDEAWYPGEAVVTTEFTEQDGRTTLTLTVAYESREARDMAMDSGMAEGVEAGYDRLAGVLASL